MDDLNFFFGTWVKVQYNKDGTKQIEEEKEKKQRGMVCLPDKAPFVSVDYCANNSCKNRPSMVFASTTPPYRNQEGKIRLGFWQRS